MAINKKIKSFSPYNYNVQYATPGAGFNKNKKQYVKSSPVNQEEYVVTKRKLEFFTYLTNTFNYTINDECEINFLNLTSTFLVTKNDYFSKSFTTSENNSKLVFREYIFDNSNIIDNTIKVDHNFFTSNVDCIVLLDDSEYLNFSMKNITKNSVKIVLDKTIKLQRNRNS